MRRDGRTDGQGVAGGGRSNSGTPRRARAPGGVLVSLFGGRCDKGMRERGRQTIKAQGGLGES